MLGYLSPKGSFFECEYFGHSRLATDICEKFYGLCSFDCSSVLSQKGWVVLRATFAGIDRFHEVNPPKITDTQIQWIEAHHDKLSVAQLNSINMCLELDGT